MPTRPNRSQQYRLAVLTSECQRCKFEMTCHLAQAITLKARFPERPLNPDDFVLPCQPESARYREWLEQSGSRRRSQAAQLALMS